MTLAQIIKKISKIRIANLPIQDATSESATVDPAEKLINETLEKFSVSALEDYLAQHDSLAEDTAANYLASAKFSGDFHFNISPLPKGLTDYKITFICRQPNPAEVSIWLKRVDEAHEAQMRNIATAEACSAAIHTVGLPVSDFPNAQQVVFISEQDTDIVALVHGIEAK